MTPPAHEPIDPATFDAGPLAHVESRAADDGRWTLTFVRDLRHPPEKVWAALTEPAQLRRRSPFAPARALTTPGPTTLTMLDGSDAHETGEPLAGEVLEVDPPSVLVYTWGQDVLRWSLAPTDHGTRLTLEHTVDQADWMPKVAAGWHLCLVVGDRVLSGDDIGPIVGEQAMAYGWQDLHDRYAAELAGPDGEGQEAG